MKELFRKSLVEKMSNPEQLDKAVKITPSMSWLALIGVVLIFVASIVWAFLGKIPETLTVSGVIVPPKDCCAIYSDSVGTFKQYNVKVGEQFKKGDNILSVTDSNGDVAYITAPEDGTLTTALCSKGDEVNPPTQVYPGYETARYSPNVSGNLTAICYVPVTSAQKVDVGMNVQIYPLGTDNQRDGHMMGKVVSVGEYPADSQNMPLVLGKEITTMFASSGSPLISVVCEIKTDSDSKNGFYWTNKKGKKLDVGKGTLFSAKIVTDEYAPITKLFSNLGGGKS